nr:hypothetical protein [Sediminitomix flava]
MYINNKAKMELKTREKVLFSKYDDSVVPSIAHMEVQTKAKAERKIAELTTLIFEPPISWVKEE